MTTVDQLLIELCRAPYPTFESIKEDRDRRILNSLFRQMLSGNFLTENQGNLLVKIFKENLPSLILVNTAYETAVAEPSWSQPFRVVEQIRKIYLGPPNSDTFILEFTFSKRLKQKVSELPALLGTNISALTPKQYSIPLTEKNIYVVVNTFKGDHFEIDQKILDFYQEISEIIKSNDTPFDIFSTTNTKLIDQVENDIGKISKENLLLLNDRKIQYQYQISEEFDDESLAASIANRKTSKIFIDSKHITLTDIVAALKQLDRLPLLVIFDHYEAEKSWNMLQKLREAILENNLSKVGIYFRFDNGSNDATNFNSLIKVSNFNQYLDTDSEVVGIASGKLPKFMLKSDWYPRSVLNLQNSYKNNRTTVYCNSSDLIINYGETQPLSGDIYAIV